MSVAHWAHRALPDHELPGLSPEEYVVASVHAFEARERMLALRDMRKAAMKLAMRPWVRPIALDDGEHEEWEVGELLADYDDDGPTQERVIEVTEDYLTTVPEFEDWLPPGRTTEWPEVTGLISARDLERMVARFGNDIVREQTALRQIFSRDP